MMTDMRKSPHCGLPPEIYAFGIYAATAGDTTAARAYIEGFL